MSGTIPLRDQKILCLKSGNCCALPECRKKLIVSGTADDKDSIIGEVAHIKGERLGSARYDATMTDKERNSYKNLILVCGNHHKVIDDQPQTYTAEKLYVIKKEHEMWVANAIKQEMVNVTFAELNVVTKYLYSGQATIDDSLVLVPPRDKIKKNGLSQEITNMILQGMVQVKQVGTYISNAPDIDFGERLKQGFVNEYQRLKNGEKLTGNDLFNALFEFATGGSNNFRQTAAGLAVLVYLFEKCEVFEK